MPDILSIPDHAHIMKFVSEDADNYYYQCTLPHCYFIKAYKKRNALQPKEKKHANLYKGRKS